MVLIKQLLEYLKENQVEYTYQGSGELALEHYCPLSVPRNSCITWIRNAGNYSLSGLTRYDNLLVVCNPVDITEAPEVNYLFTEDPHSVFFSLLEQFFILRDEEASLVEESSVVETEQIGKNVRIGHHCYIGKEVILGDHMIIKNRVSIEGKVRIGDHTIIYSGAVIGMDGYAYYDNVKGHHLRVPHPGGIIIGNHVEIGANTCIARGCLGDTVISDEVKIDNLCHIAHNVFIGKRSKIIASSMLAGSSVIGEDVWVAPCTAVKNQVVVGNHSLLGMGAVVTKNVEPGVVAAGVPARVLRENRGLP